MIDFEIRLIQDASQNSPNDMWVCRSCSQMHTNFSRNFHLPFRQTPKREGLRRRPFYQLSLLHFFAYFNFRCSAAPLLRCRCSVSHVHLFSEKAPREGSTTTWCWGWRSCKGWRVKYPCRCWDKLPSPLDLFSGSRSPSLWTSYLYKEPFHGGQNQQHGPVEGVLRNEDSRFGE